MDQLLTDIRFAARQIVRAPGFTFVAVLTLALGIGANSALYSVADALIRRPRPGVGESSSLVWIAATSEERSRPMGLSYQVAARVRDEVPLFERVATIRGVPLSLGTRGDAVKVQGEAVSSDYFTTLRTPFSLGRGFTAQEDSGSGAHPVAVLSDYAWRTWLGADPAVVGKAITVNGMPLTVIGVTAPQFNGADIDDQIQALWIPSAMITTLIPDWKWMLTDASNSNIRAIARLRSINDREQANAALQRLSSTIAAADTAQPKGWTLRTYDASAGLPAGAVRQIVPLAALSLAVTGLILLICCANVSNLMLARALSRQREIATRLSIGASRWRIVRQLLTESVVLSLVASAVGLLLATWGSDLVLATALPLPLDLSLDWRVFGVSAALALSVGVLFGLAPALHATRGGTAEVLRQSATGGDGRRSRLQGGLVVAQVALSLLLLTMSGLFLRSLDKAQRLDLGFDASERVLAVAFDLGLQRYDSARARMFSDQLVAQAKAMPGVETVTLTSLLPLSEWSTASVHTQRAEGAEPSAEVLASLSVVAPSFFRTVSQGLVAGRDFGEGDVATSLPVAIVTERFAREQLGGKALGARLSTNGANGPWLTVVGVVRDAVQALNAPAPSGVYVPLRQRPSSGLTMLVRTKSGNASALAPALRDAIRAMDPALPVHRLETMARVREAATREQRGGATVLAIFGALALVLAAVGLHGVMLFTVRQRTREIGIRMALGATRRAVVGIFIRRGVRLTMVGGAVGIVLALGATQLLRSLLFGVAPTDAFTFLAVSLLFLVVALVASWLPARRAALVDPVTAMRAE
ncbi:MAG: ABC transporter permease [Gemmatimonadaceae bacterium]|nr:ABC transporter permease [Gemmatimonadaceae bacterium]